MTDKARGVPAETIVPPPEHESFADRLRRMMAERNLTVADIQRGLSTSRSVVERWLKGGHASHKNQTRLAQFMGVAVEDIVGVPREAPEALRQWLQGEALRVQPPLRPHEEAMLRNIPEPPGQRLTPAFYTMLLTAYRTLGSPDDALDVALYTTDQRAERGARQSRKKL